MDFSLFSDAVRPYVLVLFVVAFLGLIVWVLSPRRKKRLEAYKNIPFKED
jgi:cbb3-type cytochrome oxidase subunit 3